MPVDKDLLEILACPLCKVPVEEVRDGTGLRCGECGRIYPVEDDIPVMLIEEAEEGPGGAAAAGGEDTGP